MNDIHKKIDDIYKDAVFPISGKRGDSKGNGTGFAVHKDESCVYILTCYHVLKKICNDQEPIAKELIWVAGKNPSGIFTLPKSDIHDMALLQVENIRNVRVFGLMDSLVSEMAVFVPVCQKRTRAFDVEPMNGVIEKENVRTTPYLESRLKSCKLKMNRDCELCDGNSGSPVVDMETGHAVGIVTHDQENGVLGCAISIVGLRDIWPDMPDLIKIPPKSQQSSGDEGWLNPYLIDFHPQIEKICETLDQKRRSNDPCQKRSPMIFFLHGKKDHPLFLTNLENPYWEEIIETDPALRERPKWISEKHPVTFSDYEVFVARMKAVLSAQIAGTYNQPRPKPGQKGEDVFDGLYKLTKKCPVMFSISVGIKDLISHRENILKFFLDFWKSYSGAIENKEPGKFPLLVFLVLDYTINETPLSFREILGRPLGALFKPSEEKGVIGEIRQLLTTETYAGYALPELCGADYYDVNVWANKQVVVNWLKRKNIKKKEALKGIFKDKNLDRRFIESLAPDLKESFELVNV